MNEMDGTKPAARPLDAYGDIEDLDCKGRRVLLRVDPYLLDTLNEGEVQDLLAYLLSRGDRSAAAFRR